MNTSHTSCGCPTYPDPLAKSREDLPTLRVKIATWVMDYERYLSLIADIFLENLLPLL
jgi:hypothetical protein